MKIEAQEAFFEGITQVESLWHGQILKAPFFYRDSTAVSALFAARIPALKTLLPDRRLRPARLLPGIGVLALSVVQHRDTDMHAFNEVAIGIVLENPDFAGIPGYNLLRQLRGGQGCFYIVHLPVTSDTARTAGMDIYGLDRFLATIEFGEGVGDLGCELSEGGELILAFTGRRIETPGDGLGTYRLYAYQNGQIQGCEVRIQALEKGVSWGPGGVELVLGDVHPIARELSEVLLWQRALLYAYTPRLQAILFGPERLPPPLMKAILEAFFPQAQLASKAQRRHHAREKVDVPCEINAPHRHTRHRIRGRVVDISRGGMFVKTANPLEVGARIEAAIMAPEAGGALRVRGQVTRCTLQGCAVTFSGNETGDLERLVGLLP